MTATARSYDDPLVGWVKKASEGFSNARDARALTDFANVHLNPTRVDYFRDYLKEYYDAEFIPGQGAEVALGYLEELAPAGSWLDLGAGTTTLFWSIPLRDVSTVACCDIAAEALFVLDEFASSSEIPGCYQQVLEMYGKTASHLRSMRQKPRHYYVFDVLSPWPEGLWSSPFDLVTAFGSFGISATSEGYEECFKYLAQHLAPGGRAIGADWVRWPSFIEQDGHDNSYLAASLTRHAAGAAGLEVLECRQVPIAGDPYYRALICWALELRVGD